MRTFAGRLSLSLALALTSCNNGSGAVTPSLPPPSGSGVVPASVTAVTGYHVSVFAELTGSTKPDSIVQVGSSVFIGVGDTVNPDGTPGASGVAQTEVLQYDLSGTLLKTYEVPGHNDGLMAYDDHTLWAMSNEDANARLVVIDVTTGTHHLYTPQPSLVDASGGLPHGGGLDDMAMVGGAVYVSGSSPAVSTTAVCPANSSTPGCPNGVSTAPFVYTLSLNGDGATFDLTPVMSSGAAATSIATGASAVFNITDPDSEVLTPDGSKLIVDGQGDAELGFITLTAPPSLTFLPLTLGGVQQQVDDTRFVPTGKAFALLADTPSNRVYRIDGGFSAGDAYSAGQTMFLKTNIATGTTAAVVSGLQAPHGIAFITARN